MAVGRDLHKDTYQIVPVIGDGALSGGMAMEALTRLAVNSAIWSLFLTITTCPYHKMWAQWTSLYQAADKQALYDIEGRSERGIIHLPYGFLFTAYHEKHEKCSQGKRGGYLYIR